MDSVYQIFQDDVCLGTWATMEMAKRSINALYHSVMFEQEQNFVTRAKCSRIDGFDELMILTIPVWNTL